MSRYIKNRSTFKCKRCGNIFKMDFWDWMMAPHLFDIWRYSECPLCGKKSWNKIYPNWDLVSGTPLSKADWVECHKCIYRDECETREMRDGCYLGDEK